MPVVRRALRSLEVPSDRLAVVRRSVVRRGLLGSTAFLALAVFAQLASGLLPAALRHAVASGFGATLAFAVLGLLASTLPLAKARRGGALRVEPERVVVACDDGEQVVPLDRIEDGWTLETPRGVELILRLRGGDTLEARTVDAHAARSVLEALGLDAARHATRVGLSRVRFEAVLVGVAFLASACPAGIAASVVNEAHVGDAWTWLTLAGVMTLATLGVAALRASKWIAIGTDGVTARLGLRTRFIPFAELRAVYVLGSSVLLKGRRDVLVPTFALDAPTRDALLARLNAAILIARGRAGAGAGVTLLDRGNRSLDAWREGLRALVAQGEGYRTRALTHDDIVRVLEDAASPADRRVAAALVLAWTPGGGAVERVRVVADASANEPVRVALNDAAEHADDPRAVDDVLRRAAAMVPAR